MAFGLIIIIILLFFIVMYFNKKVPGIKEEKFSDYGNARFGNRNSFYRFLDNGLKGTPIKSIDSIESKRFPFIVENTTNVYNSDSPTLNSGYTLGTDLGRNPEDKCVC
jgi:hypothetical protein